MTLSPLDPVWFRLVAPLPFDVVFPSITYTLQIESPEHVGGKTHQLVAIPKGECTPNLVSEIFARIEWIEEDLYTCFCTRHATIGEAVMIQASKLGLAVAMDQPQYLPGLYRGRPRSYNPPSFCERAIENDTPP